MTTSLRILPLDYVHPEDPEADQKSLIRYLERTGKLKAVQPFKITRARTLYVRKGYSKQHVASAVGVDLPVVDRWIMAFGWDELREQQEFRHYQKVSNIRRKAVPNIDEKHDRMFYNLENLVEDTIHRIRQSGEEVSPRDLSTLANAARVCMDCRRVVHKKEGPVSRHILELQDNSVFNEFAAMLANEVAKPELTNGPSGEVIKKIPFTIEDHEYEDEQDII